MKVGDLVTKLSPRIYGNAERVIGVAVEVKNKKPIGMLIRRP